MCSDRFSSRVACDTQRMRHSDRSELHDPRLWREMADPLRTGANGVQLPTVARCSSRSNRQLPQHQRELPAPNRRPNYRPAVSPVSRHRRSDSWTFPTERFLHGHWLRMDGHDEKCRNEPPARVLLHAYHVVNLPVASCNASIVGKVHTCPRGLIRYCSTSRPSDPSLAQHIPAQARA